MSEEAPPDAAGLALARYRRARRESAGRDPGPRRPGRRRSVVRGELRSGPGPDSRDPMPLSSALTRLVSDRGWGEEISVWSLTHRWDQIVGPQVASHVRVIDFRPADEAAEDPGGPARRGRRGTTSVPTQESLLEPTEPAAGGQSRAPAEQLRAGGVLVLEAENPTWRSTMSGLLPDLHRRLDRELGADVVGTIIVRLPQRRSYGPRRARR